MLGIQGYQMIDLHGKYDQIFFHMRARNQFAPSHVLQSQVEISEEPPCTLPVDFRKILDLTIAISEKS